MDSNRNYRSSRIFRQLVKLPLIVTLSIFLVNNVLGGVLVAPTSVILSDSKRTGRLTVQNPSDKPTEVTIAFSFGIPQSDSLGNTRLELSDSNVTDPQSALGWIKAFPRKLVLEPNSSQVIRFVAQPPKDLPDGEYWCRVMVRSQAGETTIPDASDQDKISTKLNMIMQTAIILKYRTGNLISKLEVLSTEAKRTDSTVAVLVSMANRGNVSYVGLLSARLLDPRGQQISQTSIDLAVYHELTRKLDLPIKDQSFEPPFKVEISISNEGRSDIPPEEMIVGNSIDYVAQVE